ncbi:MAG TPA: Clp protease N-terminal domain-containing protein [Labilithrix sp.]|nr:Clp protease N-terminal domain-containing protein [Labilithrix sp.]
MASLIDKLIAGISPHSTSIRGMASTLLAAPLVVAGAAGHAQADVEHLLHVLLGLVDVAKALKAHGVYPDDVLEAVEQLLDDRAPLEGDARPTRSPRLQTVTDLALRLGGSSADVITSVAAALPRELVFLRRPLEEAAREVAPLYDGALAAKDGAMTFQAWDPDLRGVMATMQNLADTKWKPWTMGSLTLLLTILCSRRYFEAFRARGIVATELIAEIGRALPTPRWTRPPPEGHVAGIGPSLYATILRAEHYAAEDASDVRLRHVLASLHDEPLLAPFVERIAG